MLNDPGYITEVLKRPRVFIKDKETQALDGLVGKGLVTSEGDFWAQQRRLAQPIFLPRGVYFPFNDGPRFCIGKNFAIMEALLLLATIAQQFQLDLVPEQMLEPRTSFALKPKHGLQVVLKANS